MNIYSHLKSRGMNNVKFLIGNEKFAKEIQKINPVNNNASNKSKEPTTRPNGVWLLDKMSDKGWSIVDIAITTHYLGEWWLLKRSEKQVILPRIVSFELCVWRKLNNSAGDNNWHQFINDIWDNCNRHRVCISHAHEWEMRIRAQDMIRRSLKILNEIYMFIDT